MLLGSVRQLEAKRTCLQAQLRNGIGKKGATLHNDCVEMLQKLAFYSGRETFVAMHKVPSNLADSLGILAK
jgi:hypothetical protein